MRPSGSRTPTIGTSDIRSMSRDCPEISQHLREVMNQLGRETSSVMGPFAWLHAAGPATVHCRARRRNGSPWWSGSPRVATAASPTTSTTHSRRRHPCRDRRDNRCRSDDGGGPAVLYGCEALEALQHRGCRRHPVKSPRTPGPGVRPGCEFLNTTGGIA